jgi:hypothetical protein
MEMIGAGEQSGRHNEKMARELSK